MPPHALQLPDELAERALGGSPVLDISLLGDRERSSAEPGRPLLLLDKHGGVIGSAIADPENEVIRVLARDPVDSFDLPFFRRRVSAAFKLRQALGLPGPDAAYRLIHGEGDELSGFAADVYGPFAVLYAYSRGLVTLGRLLAAAIQDVVGSRGVVLKVRPKGGTRPGQVRQEVVGEEPPEKLMVRENDIPFEVHLLSGLNVGLFTDMREHRRGLRRFVSGRRVLNTFAYTGTLSVAAALAGAREVTSVDLSSGVLKWAMENFRLSGLDPLKGTYRFEACDVLRFIRQETARGAAYDVIILDPPTYSAARAAGWSMKNDYPELMAAAARLLPGEDVGFLWVSANAQRSRALLRHVEAAFQICRRQARVLEIGGLPPDYPTPLGYPEGRYLEVCYLEVTG
jgi:23S rRNA (cytosine1962-C5)-methyltransferase